MCSKPPEEKEVEIRPKKHKFAVGDEVKFKEKNYLLGTILENDNRYRDSEYVKLESGPQYHYIRDNLELYEKGEPMSIKDRIDALTGWSKEADDILQELNLDKKYNYPRIEIGVRSNELYGGGRIRIIDNSSSSYAPLEEFSYYTQCEKLQAFKDALLWLAEKSGKLDDKKDKVKAEIKDLKDRIDKLEDTLND